ncbi:MAG: hypothetical protein JW794_01645 [Candidatus Cloacimonetes bacterium]|nr:hypothetical protein [Candidatus Cloacimonadota bacterium]
MDANGKKMDRSGWAVGGGTMIGIGVGFFLLPLSVFYLIGSILGGIGLGLIIGAIIGK